MAETKREKAVRYLAEGRLTVERIDANLIVASCRGESGEVYKLGWRGDQDRFGCTCEAAAKFRRECCHVIGLKLVVSKPQKPRAGTAGRRGEPAGTSGGA